MSTSSCSGFSSSSIVSLTRSLRGQLVKCFTTIYQNTLMHFDEKKMRETFAKATHKFSTKNFAALLFWFFGGFRCDVPLFIVILVIY